MDESIIHDLSVLREAAIRNEEENEQFGMFLKKQDSNEVDALVHRLNSKITPEIDCRQCGNCCRSLMINVRPGEPEKLSTCLNMSLEEFKEKHIEESQEGEMVMNTIPCHFLEDRSCSIYKHRFIECREFPHLHKPGFVNRLFANFMHYGRCPIIFNVIEKLKEEIDFR